MKITKNGDVIATHGDMSLIYNYPSRIITAKRLGNFLVIDYEDGAKARLEFGEGKFITPYIKKYIIPSGKMNLGGENVRMSRFWGK